jgi:phospholipase/carboxylesterase
MQPVIEHRPAQGRPEQLLLLLHGWAQEARALGALADALHQAFPQSAVLVPEAPTPADGGRRGRQWYSIEGLRETPDAWPPVWQPRSTARTLGAGPAAAAGRGPGGHLPGRLLAGRGAVAGTGGPARRHCRPRAGLRRPLRRTAGVAPRHTTLHFFHGQDDAVFPVDGLQQTFEHLGALQGDATIDIAHGVGHEVHPVLIERALFRLRNHIPLRTWQAALGAAAGREPG